FFIYNNIHSAYISPTLSNVLMWSFLRGDEWNENRKIKYAFARYRCYDYNNANDYLSRRNISSFIAWVTYVVGNRISIVISFFCNLGVIDWFWGCNIYRRFI